ncbi:glycosyl transferase, group 2 [Thermosulfidibacter takaii ABI70S6]|uniref:Glycosyl transferase, group 2 n=1 Tax=Thermosulfidibacter takaii (strain DSM 17441 / JCM 13301 / NBRC 103674 / ABI70S6) TaxID=1298851 RepID=A0A0S3QS08_THET7|nr:glycosyltransferase [Thermosulfidibacter takaii]BAT71130.1 glycosyl transferase, group 2 [Thermosulfidibacter takaii ABI70S6]
MPLVSVVIPTYNRAQFVKRAIQSALSQDLKNIEVIVVDDGSQDNTEEVIKNIKDDRLIYIKHEANRGVSEARNTGIKAAQGKYIAFLDSDDFWAKNKISKQLEAFEKNPEAGLCYTSVNFIDPNGKIKRVQRAIYSGYIYPLLLEKNIIGPTSSVMVKKETLLLSQLFNTKLNYREDYEMWLRIAKQHPVIGIDETLTFQVVHTNKRLSSDLTRRIESFEYILQEFKDDFEKHPKAFARQLYELGKIYLKTNNKVNARQIFWHSFTIRPSINAVSKYLSTFI